MKLCCLGTLNLLAERAKLTLQSVIKKCTCSICHLGHLTEACRARQVRLTSVLLWNSAACCQGQLFQHTSPQAIDCTLCGRCRAAIRFVCWQLDEGKLVSTSSPESYATVRGLQLYPIQDLIDRIVYKKLLFIVLLKRGLLWYIVYSELSCTVTFVENSEGRMASGGMKTVFVYLVLLQGIWVSGKWSAYCVYRYRTCTLSDF